MDLPVDGTSQTATEKFPKKLKTPFAIFIPLFITALSFWSVKDYFGNPWAVGDFTMPVFPVVIAIIADVFDVKAHVLLSGIILVIYAFGPCIFYLFVLRLTHRQLPAFLTGLMTILPLNPLSESSPSRLLAALVNKDGAHIMSLTFIPLVSLLFLKYLKSNKLLYLLAFEIAVAVIGCISLFALFILLIFMISMTISEVLLGLGREKIMRFLISIGISSVVTVVIYNLFLLSVLSSEEGKTTISVVGNFLPLLFFLVPVLGTIAFLIFDRRPVLQPVFIALSMGLVFGLLHFMRISVADIPLLEQNRYASEAAFMYAFILGLTFMGIFDFMRQGTLLKRIPILYKHRLFSSLIYITIVIGVLSGSVLFINRSII